MYILSNQDIQIINKILALHGVQLLSVHNNNEQLFLFTKSQLDNFAKRVQNDVLNEINGVLSSVGSLFSNTSLS